MKIAQFRFLPTLSLLVLLIALAWSVHESPGLMRNRWDYLLWLALAAWGIWLALSRLSAAESPLARFAGLLVPVLFAAWMLYFWQLIVVGFAVPSVLLPPPTKVFAAISENTGILLADFFQTFVKSVIPGYLIGCGFGFAIALASWRWRFLERGLLPLGNLMSAIPIVGVAPIMVMWFGFDWQSKAAVAAVMTFFPMLINTLAGLDDASPQQRELMKTYASSSGQRLLKLHLPGALPFLFNALKLNSTLALIGAIVAEFFGTPIVGMGFRISTEVGRMNIEMVWATIIVAAVVGSTVYGLLTLLERALTFWHPSYRG